MKKDYIKKNIIGFIVGVILCMGSLVYAAVTFPSNEVSYDNTESGLSSTTVKGAIDELYNECILEPPASDTITDLLISNPDELYKDEHGDIRYYGANPNNYISFNNELWRIIGVINGKVKIIRNESIGEYDWDLNYSNDWNNASLKNYLNVDYYNSINKNYQKMISLETYYFGGSNRNNYYTLTASGYYNAEKSRATQQYIGLMYPSDYGYAAGNSCLSTALLRYNNSCKNSDYLFVGIDEWLQSHKSDETRMLAYLSNGGLVTSGTNGQFFNVRPSLYLTVETIIIGGDGSQNNPYTLG